jgi:hypothetical protein
MIAYRFAVVAIVSARLMRTSMKSMAIHGVRLVPTGVHISATHVRNAIPTGVRMYQTEVSIGVKVASITPTGVMIARNTMQTDAIDAQRILMVMVIVLSMTIRTDLMLSSIVPTRMSDCSSV